LGAIVKVSYMFFMQDKIEASKAISRLVISIVIWYMVWANISDNIERHWVELYWPLIWMSSFFSVDIVQRLSTYKIKDILKAIAQEILNRLKQ